jgi:hypothetical protein
VTREMVSHLRALELDPIDLKRKRDQIGASRCVRPQARTNAAACETDTGKRKRETHATVPTAALETSAPPPTAQALCGPDEDTDSEDDLDAKGTKNDNAAVRVKYWNRALGQGLGIEITKRGRGDGASELFCAKSVT